MNENEILLFQQRVAFVARASRDMRAQAISYAKAAGEAMGGGFLLSGETPEALQNALPRLALYAKMADHIVALADLCDEMVKVVQAAQSPSGKLILPMRMVVEKSQEPQTPTPPTEEKP